METKNKTKNDEDDDSWNEFYFKMPSTFFVLKLTKQNYLFVVYITQTMVFFF